MLEVVKDLRDRGIEVIYAPNCQPAEQSARMIAEALHLKVKRIDQLKNVDQGLWEGLCVEEVRRKHPKVFRQWQQRPGTVRPPEGETIGEAEERVRATVNRILRRHRSGKIAMVLPEPIASLVTCMLSGNGSDKLWKTTKKHGTWEVLEIESQQAVAELEG